MHKKNLIDILRKKVETLKQPEGIIVIPIDNENLKQNLINNRREKRNEYKQQRNESKTRLKKQMVGKHNRMGTVNRWRGRVAVIRTKTDD